MDEGAQNPIKFQIEQISISDLKPHPRNYKVHPKDQLEHIMYSIKENGVYKNLIIAKDQTILAGHGVYEASKVLGIKTLPCIRLDIDPNSPTAMKVIIGDNEIGHLAEVNDRMLSDILKEIKDSDIEALLGTGYDAKMLANLAFVTRPASEIFSMNEAEEWAGLVPYQEKGSNFEKYQLVVRFPDKENAEKFIDLIKEFIKPDKKSEKSYVAFYPRKPKNDIASVRIISK